jgi:PucR-like helix-turn-helix protein
MATLGELHKSLLPAAVPVRPMEPTQADRVVEWVRVLKARVPAFDALDPGDLVIVPAAVLAVVAPEQSDVVVFADGLLRARVCGALVLDSAAPARHRVGEALAAAGVTTLVLAATEAVANASALERSIIGYLVNQRAELERQAALLEAQLERIALGASDLQALVAAIAAFLGRAAALEGHRGDALAIQAPAGVADAGAATAAYISRPRTAALRIPLPASADETTSPGALVLLGERPPSELDRIAGERIAGLLALEIARAESVRRARDDARRSEALPAAGPPWVVLLARQTPPGIDLELEEREQVRREIRRLAPARSLSLRGDAASLELRLVAACPVDDPGGLAVAGRLAAFLDRPVAVSRAFADPAQRPVQEAAARSALEAGESLPEPPAVVRADHVAIYRLVGNLRNVPDGLRDARALLAPVLGGRPAAERARLATLRAVLDHGSPSAAASVLGVHRNTISYRIRRIESAGSWDLADPELRLALGIAVRIVQSAQE